MFVFLLIKSDVILKIEIQIVVFSLLFIVFFSSSRTKLTASSFHIAVTGMYSCCMIASKCEVCAVNVQQYYLF